MFLLFFSFLFFSCIFFAWLAHLMVAVLCIAAECSSFLPSVYFAFFFFFFFTNQFTCPLVAVRTFQHHITTLSTICRRFALSLLCCFFRVCAVALFCPVSNGAIISFDHSVFADAAAATPDCHISTVLASHVNVTHAHTHASFQS